MDVCPTAAETAMYLESKEIRKLAQELLEVAADAEEKGLCLAICDSHGHLVLFVRTENAAPRGIPIAMDKAYTAAMMECSTLFLHGRLEQEKLALADFCDPRFTAMPGGAPIVKDGLTLGGLGLSGCKPERDQVWADKMAKRLAGE